MHKNFTSIATNICSQTQIGLLLNTFTGRFGKVVFFKFCSVCHFNKICLTKTFIFPHIFNLASI